MSLFKTETADISGDLNLDMEGLVAKVIPISWLPAGVQIQYLSFKDVDMSTAEGAADGVRLLGELVEKVVASWNMPRCMVEDNCGDECEHSDRLKNAKGIDNLGAKLPLAISEYIMEVASRESGDIPLESAPSLKPVEPAPLPAESTPV
ncbi:MAG: hypothetical protein M0Q49_03280 [Porticoccaceae bacterium]|nr:hypothetical protein [Porticoccaceae bacterium]